MKYTVVIQQPVQEEVRADLEQQLVQGLGLSASAASKLAGRRSGRLLKPTTRAKAEKLQRIFAGVGAVVILEEVPEEGDNTSGEPSGLSAMTGVAVQTAPASVGGSTTVIAAAADPFAAPAEVLSADSVQTPAATPAAKAPASADPFASDPFGADPFASDPFGTDPFAGGSTSTQVIGAKPATVVSETPASSVSATSTVDDEWASFSQGLSGSTDSAAAGSTSQEGEDVWSDFADALRVDVPVQQRQEAVPAPLMPSFMDVAEEAPAPTAVQGPRVSLERQVLLTSLLPTAALTLVTLLLLSLLLPANERSRAQAEAQAVAHSLSSTLNAADPAALSAQLNNVVKDEDVSFVQVRTDGSTVGFASDAADGAAKGESASSASTDAGNAEAGTALQQAYEKWNGNGSGFFRNSGQTYAVAHSGNELGGSQVAVGVPYRFSPLSILLPWLLTSLLLLGLSAVWASRTAKALLGPIQRLVRSADSISAGDLTQPVRAEANDEVGDLADALERMRLSLSAAMDRLRRRKR